MEERAMVSVIMTAYNHEKYICQAIDSVLAQKTNFEFEVLVGDDASTDKTQEILLSKYAENKKIKLFLRKENVGGTRNGYGLYMRAKGKYLCVCECDDYWTDENYLQMMVDWLEQHAEYAAVGARRIAVSEKTGHKTLMVPSKDCNCDITLDDFLKRNKRFDLCACLYINFFHDGKSDYRLYKMGKHVGDLTVAIHTLQHGKLFQFEKIIGVYRTDRVKGSYNYNSITSSKAKFLEHMRIIKYMKKFCYPELDYSNWQKFYACNFYESADSGKDQWEAMWLIVRQAGLKTLYRVMVEKYYG